ncbi:hypothetical protein BDV38DRAFT_279203 [Aspergillus pseudotamarii]|uniref:LysM domain-containing protein n=1 Tax=Aspergillus pseudotamarii TaxID=132259 RepID=A0A5N6T4T9_ASPPS|nr:uncharacterized protein BDV38DRAFT_279203 [Aspergillus pseudotamarii]KAE8141300.1 hypothetical protein BDV38DRAFT_279203 [Aspergillus pseudotamarii]
MLSFWVLLQILFCESVVAWINGESATGPTESSVVDQCEYWANDIGSSDSCESIEAYFGITRAQFRSWNPDLSLSCIMTRGRSYCVAGPSSVTTSTTITATTRTSDHPGTITYSGIVAPTQNGVTSSCTKYHLVQLRDTCYTIQDEYGSYTLEQFYSWNPSIGEGCTGIQPGYYVCVRTEPKFTSVSATPTPASPTANPSNIGKGSSASDHQPHQQVSPENATSGTLAVSSIHMLMWSIIVTSMLFLSHPLFSTILPFL